MRIKAFKIHHVRLPLRHPFAHAAKVRTDTENIIVGATLSDGTEGYGEGVPRLYVTGETAQSAFEALAFGDYGALGRDFGSFEEVVAFMSQDGLGRLTTAPPPPHEPRRAIYNAAQCALELAMLDAFGRHFGRPMSDVAAAVLPLEHCDPKKTVFYSGVISSGSCAMTVVSALKQKAFGFDYVKVKVGAGRQQDLARLRWIRRVLGRKVNIRVDANGVWTLEEATGMARALKRYGVTSVEQPLPAGMEKDLPKLRQESPLPVMLDESLRTMEDARQAVAQGWCDTFNVRLSKCGGMVSSLKLVRYAFENGIGVQLGCQVGETGLLSAAGRAVAVAVKGLLFLEGSYDRFLLKRNVTREDITFGWRGAAGPIDGSGLGVTVDPDRLEQVTVKAVTKEL